MSNLATLEARVRAALGSEPLDLLIRGVRLVDVFSGRVTETDIGIRAERIVSIFPSGEAASRETIEAEGLYALPGFIDAHVHIESTLLTPASLSEVIVPTGTTTLLVDPMEVANVAGIEGIEAFFSGVEELPYRMFVQVSSRVPTAPGLETTGGELGIKQVERILAWPETVSLGELDPSKVLRLSAEHLQKVLAASKLGKIANGHAIGLEGAELEAYASVGITDDHECVTVDQLEARLAVGMAVMIREGSSERNLHDLIAGVLERQIDTRHLMFCTDDKHPSDIRREGHINYNVNEAIRLGLSPLQAIQMASINAAEHFRVGHLIGAIAPGRFADILLCASLDEIRPEMVLVGGRVVAEGGSLTDDLKPQEFPDWLKRTVRVLADLEPTVFEFPAQGTTVRLRVIEIVPDQIFNHLREAELSIKEGSAQAAPELDVLKLAVVERYGKNGNVAVGWTKGFGLKRGAIAGSVAHDHHNILVVGTNDEDMLLCVRALEESQGGFVVAEKGRILERLPLPLAGLMSELPAGEVETRLEKVRTAAASLGCQLKTPFMTLSFISLPSIPEAGFSDRGLIDVAKQALVPVRLDGQRRGPIVDSIDI